MAQKIIESTGHVPEVNKSRVENSVFVMKYFVHSNCCFKPGACAPRRCDSLVFAHHCWQIASKLVIVATPKLDSKANVWLG